MATMLLGLQGSAGHANAAVSDGLEACAVIGAETLLGGCCGSSCREVASLL